MERSAHVVRKQERFQKNM